MRILVVDDEETIREILRDGLEPLGHEIYSAADGLEALRKIEEIHPGIVILDVNMPRLDGYGVLSRIRGMEGTQRTFVLMLTAKAELAELERGLSLGADDYLSKPFHLRELIARTQAAVRIRTLQDELHLRNKQLAESLKKEERLNQKMMLEMEVAARLQKGMLSPARLDVGRVQACARYRPSTQIGGDFYDLRPLGASKVSIFLADAVGHGVSAALLAAMLKTGIEDALSGEPIPSSILTSLNRRFQFCADHGKYLTAFSGILDCESGDLVYSLAGHVPPLAYRYSNKNIEKLDSPGFCLGVFEEGRYENREIKLFPGDRLLAYTDGISEASPDDCHLFGAHFPDLLRRNADLPNEEFLDFLDDRLAGFLDAAAPADDYTLLSVHLVPGSLGGNKKP
jgi:serine phosphatase RsbU (regulator of sigma subunit)